MVFSHRDLPKPAVFLNLSKIILFSQRGLMRLAKIEFPIAPAIESVLLRIQVNTQTGHTQLIDLGRRPKLEKVHFFCQKNIEVFI